MRRHGREAARERWQGSLPAWLWYGGLGLYLLVPVLLLAVASLLESPRLFLWGLVMLITFAQTGEVFFRVVITLPLVQTVFLLRRRDLTRAQRAIPAAVNTLATVLWWSWLAAEPFPWD